MKTIIEPKKLTKKEENFLKKNMISFLGLEKIYNGESPYDHKESKLLVQDYLSKKLMMIRIKKRKLEEAMNEYNKTIKMAKQMDIEKNINGEMLRELDA